MMIIYDERWYSNLLLINKIDKLYQQQLVSEGELKDIKHKYPVGFYTPGFFVRVGMFLATIIVSLCSCGLLSLLFEPAKIVETYGWFIFLGISHYIMLEMVVRNNSHYRSGVDDSLLLISTTLLAGSFYWIVNTSSESYLLTSGFVFLLCLILCIRFCDHFISVVAYLSALVFVFLAWQKIGALGQATTPFVLMICSAVCYMIAKVNENNRVARFYSTILLLLQITSLVTLYVSGNYYVVKELNDMLNGTVSKTIPLAWFFWLWTIALPLTYIGFGIKNKNRILLRTGLLLIVTTVLTLRNYYQLMPVEQLLAIGGIALLGLSWWITKYLYPQKRGFTIAEVKTTNDFDKLQFESLTIAETFSGSGEPVAGKGTFFGGGEFGGGGQVGAIEIV